MDAEIIKNKLIENYNPEFIQLDDESDGCGTKFSLILVSSFFEGKNKIFN